MQMRRSYDVPPPRMEDDHPYWHGNDRRYVLESSIYHVCFGNLSQIYDNYPLLEL